VAIFRTYRGHCSSNIPVVIAPEPSKRKRSYLSRARLGRQNCSNRRRAVGPVRAGIFALAGAGGQLGRGDNAFLRGNLVCACCVKQCDQTLVPQWRVLWHFVVGPACLR
jgi:hypothetical protein